MTDVPANSGPAAAAPAGDGVPGDQVLLILAADHRNSLEREMYGLTAAPTPDQAARISADKLLVYQALLDAAAQLPAGVRPGILTDEQYGASIAELASSSGGAVSLSMPIEASGEEWFQFAYGDDWERHAGYFATDHAKVLVRDNPGLDPGDREEQARRLAQVSTWAAAAGRSLILELLVPATDADKQATEGSTDRYDDEIRPGYTLKVMEYLQDHGVEPAIWKVEGLDRHDDAVAVAAMAVRAGRQADCIVLGRHASSTTGCRWQHRSPAGPDSPSAEASGGTHSMRTCTTAPRQPRPGAALAAPTWSTPLTISRLGTAYWPPRPTRSSGDSRRTSGVSPGFEVQSFPAVHRRGRQPGRPFGGYRPVPRGFRRDRGRT
jgi:myo-inositol catabolism protein IolC